MSLASQQDSIQNVRLVDGENTNDTIFLSQNESSVVSFIDLPYVYNKKIFQDLHISTKKNLEVDSVSVKCVDVTDDLNTVNVFTITVKGSRLKKGKTYIHKLPLSSQNESFKINSLYLNILLKNYKLPTGQYKTYLSFNCNSTVFVKECLHTIDSVLGDGSRANNKLEKAVNSASDKSFLGLSVVKNDSHHKKTKKVRSLSSLSGRIDKSFKGSGFSINYRTEGNNTYADVYYRDKYIGYYEPSNKENSSQKLADRNRRFKGSVTNRVNNGLEGNKPSFSQIREINRTKKNNEVVGNISVTGNASNGQEEYSQNENNFYEVTGQVEVPIMNIPVLIEGYYTSQDRSRIAKASFFRLHYDSDQAKSELLSVIGNYKNKYDQNSYKEKSYKNVYGTYLKSLSTEKRKLVKSLNTELGGDVNSDILSVDTSGLYTLLSNKVSDSINEFSNIAGSNSINKDINTKSHLAQKRYNEVVKKYERLKELESKIEHYNKLLDQYSNNRFIDSVVAYDKVKDITDENGSDMSYKQLSKSAKSLLPEGHNQKFITGLTHLDLGIFSKQISSYTLNGQTIKGGDIGYDFGICEAAVTYGRVEYVSRSGFLDKYVGYSGRLNFKPARKHKTSVIYYGYMPSKSMLQGGDFFKNVDVHMPGFKTPVDIVSVVHRGAINRHINVDGEIATSFKTIDDFSDKNSNVNKRLAYKLNLEGGIPHTTIGLRGGYEHVGKQFENNTLPLNLSGTARYNAEATGYFLKNFLMLGVEYNYLIQDNFSSRSAHSKWGFQVKTISKRYPSASLSYKPFTTFRSFADTFNIVPKPILGSVWLGKLSYQIKNANSSIRLTAIYNKNNSLIDTLESGSNIAQLNAIYMRGRSNLMVNIGQSDVQASRLTPVHGKTSFLSIALGYYLNPQWSINLGQDIGYAKFGFSRYGSNVGCGYNFDKVPVSIRTRFRYTSYRMETIGGWKNLFAGSIDVNWRFKFKINDKI